MYARLGVTTRLESCRVFDCHLDRLAAKCCALTIVQAASMVLAAGAQAQTSACDQLKAVLAARIDASSVRGYSLEAVPAGALVPFDAKVIGTCESGARKILYRRWGATRASSRAASAVVPATAAQAIVMPDQQTRQAPGVQVERRLQSVTASASSPAPQPVSRSNEAAVAAPTPARVADISPTGRAGQVEPVRAADRGVTQPAPFNTGTTVEMKTPLARQASEFIAVNWRWVGALVLLAAVGWVWVWRAHFSAYDKAGLPRGPRL